MALTPDIHGWIYGRTSMGGTGILRRWQPGNEQWRAPNQSNWNFYGVHSSQTASEFEMGLGGGHIDYTPRDADGDPVYGPGELEPVIAPGTGDPLTEYDSNGQA